MFIRDEHNSKFSLKIEQVMAACEAIYQHCLANDTVFAVHKYLRLDDIKAKRVELGFEAGSNTTIIKGKRIWLEQNQHRIDNPGTAPKEEDPMLGLVQKFRTDLRHEADEKIQQAENTWSEEKECFIIDMDLLTAKLDELSQENSAVAAELNETQTALEILHEKYNKTFMELHRSKGETTRLEKVYSDMNQQLELLYIKHESDKKESMQTISNYLDEAALRESQQQTKWQASLDNLKEEFRAEQQRNVDMIRSKEEESVELRVSAGNIKLQNVRLNDELKLLKENDTKKNAKINALESAMNHFEGKASALETELRHSNKELIVAKTEEDRAKKQVERLREKHKEKHHQKEKN